MKKPLEYEKTEQASENLPYGKFKNESQPGAQDGTKIVAEHLQDVQYPLLQVLMLAGIVPNGELENGKTVKQFLDALCNISFVKYSDTTVYNKGISVFTVLSGVTDFYRSLIDENNQPLTSQTAWQNFLRIDADGKINFLTPTNIASGGGSSYVPFCVNSGPIVDGEESLLSISGNTITATAPFTLTSAEGETRTVSSDRQLDVSTLQDGDYTILYNFETDALEAFGNTIFTDKKFPDEAVVGDMLFNISVVPYKCEIKTESGTETKQYSRIGQYTRVSGGAAP